MVLISKEDAKASGLGRYFTGKLCRHGHVAERWVGNSTCLECGRAQVAKWTEDNPSGSSAIKKRWRVANPKKQAETGKKWRDANRERHRANDRRRYANNSEYHAEYRRKNKDKIRAAVSAWFRANPDKRRAYLVHRRAMQASAAGSFTIEDVARIRVQQRDCCGYCRLKLRGGGHLDHIQALSRGGSNWSNNLQWLCHSCNESKSAKDPIVFAQSLGMLL